MKLYHGSPKKLRIIKPTLAKGIGKFENQKAVFLCKSFHHAALYAIGKTLKGKAVFAVTPKRLIIVGKAKPGKGYVYEADVKGAVRGERGQYSYAGKIRPLKIYVVFPDKYRNSLVYVMDKEILLKKLHMF